MTKMQVNAILQKLNFGNSVAENDRDLQHYFVETEVYRKLAADEADLILGDKGTGKSALYQILISRSDELRNVEVITAFNPTGDPIFQKLLGKQLNEAQYIAIWKTYFFSLVGNWLLSRVGKDHSEFTKRIAALLDGLGLLTDGFEVHGVFKKLLDRLSTVIPKKVVSVGAEFGPTGSIAVSGPSVELGQQEPAVDTSAEDKPFDRHTEALRLLNDALAKVGLTAWLVLDRLDEAFQGEPETEIPALRALLRTYLDLKEFDRLRLKIFVRKDLFRKVSEGGFVNLTHVGSKSTELIWDDEDLLNLLVRRVKANEEFAATLDLAEKGDEDVFYTLFPDQVDAGERKPKTWNWMLTRFGDAASKPPRNLIELVTLAKEEQQRKEGREPAEYEEGRPLIRPEAIKAALSRLSKNRVNDTLLAESGDFREQIEKFRGGKAEHTLATIRDTLQFDDSETRKAIQVLIQIGFLEQKGESYKIPALYRDGLSITQGKASLSVQDSDLLF